MSKKKMKKNDISDTENSPGTASVPAFPEIAAQGSEEHLKATALTKDKVTVHEWINFDKIPENPVKVSIVMPVCNVEEYLRQCVESCIDQTLKDIEIICVNDGSKDSSLEILKEYAAKDDRVKIINKDNAGYGHTMNIGMDMARGEFIGIVESDDFVDLKMYEELYEIASRNDVDLIKADFNRFKVINDYYDCEYFHISKDPTLYNKVLDLTECIPAYKLVMNTWSGIYKNSYLKEHNIRHNETPGASYQDNGFWFQTFAYAKKGYFVDKPYYMNRRDNPNSSVYSKAKVFCMCDEYSFIRNIIDNNPQMNNLISVYQLPKFHNYRFNYTRVAPEYKLPFLKVFHDEFKEAQEKGELDKSLFTETEWKELMDIVRDDYVEFNSAFYWEKLMWNREKVLELEERVEELTKPGKPDISIIVPVYNVALYLEKCLKSLTSQTYRNIEIICVDDGSTDASPIILNAYATKDIRVKVITTENHGVSHARNTGIRAASGQYMMFVDADDYIENKTCEILVNNLKNSNADMIVFGGSTTTKVKWIDERLTPKAAMFDGNAAEAMFSCNSIKPFCFNKIIRSSLIKENELYFDENFALGEDQLWLFRVVPAASKVQVITDKLYHYLTGRKDSAMAKFEKLPDEKTNAHLQIVDKTYEDWKDKGYLAGYEAEFAQWLINFLYNALAAAGFNKRVQTCRMIVEKYGELIENYESDGTDETTLKNAALIKSLSEYSAEKVKISVIIPVYNSETYLAECLDSVGCQTFFDIEIIAVDDGSDDNSPAILKRAAEYDDRIKIVTQENSFAGVARNNGMAQAHGDYLMFLDSDDFFSRKMLETLYDTITESDSDICICSGQHYHTDTGKYEKVHSLLNEKLIPEEAPFSAQDVSGCIYNMTSSVVWNKMFRRAFIEENGLRFSETRTANDVAFVNQALAYAEKITYTKEVLAFYRVGQTTNLQTVKKSVPLDFYNEFLKVKKGLVERGLYEDMRRTFSSAVFSNFLYHLNTIGSVSGFCTIYDKLMQEGKDDFDLYYADYDDDYFVLDFLNKEYKKLKFENAQEYLFGMLRQNTAQIAELKKSVSDEQRKAKETADKLEWNRSEVKRLKDKAEKELKKDNTVIELQNKLKKAETDLKKADSEIKKAKQNAQDAQNELDNVRKSVSFKCGRFMTWLPRKLRGEKK